MKKAIEEYVRSIPDFPEEGIIFRDVTSILEDADGLHLAIDLMQEKLKDVDFDVVVGPESRGFIFGVPIAYNLNKAFIPVRKKGKLPCETVEIEYDLDLVNDGTLDEFQNKCIELVREIEKNTKFERHVVKRPVVKEG